MADHAACWHGAGFLLAEFSKTIPRFISIVDQEIRNKEPKKKPQHGKRADFLAQYKVVGYEKAKEIINKDFKREVFNDETLKKWIEEENEK